MKENIVTPDIFILGDFNLPHTSWPEGKHTQGAPNDEKLCIDALNSLANEFLLQQCICMPTHKDGNILDLIWTNNRDLVHSYSCLPTSHTISHHSLINVNLHKCLFQL